MCKPPEGRLHITKPDFVTFVVDFGFVLSSSGGLLDGGNVACALRR
jgi:hypothetical protein